MRTVVHSILKQYEQLFLFSSVYINICSYILVRILTSVHTEKRSFNVINNERKNT